MIRGLLGLALACGAQAASPELIAVSVCELGEHPESSLGKRVRVTGMAVPDAHGITLRSPKCFDTVIAVLPGGPGFPAFRQVLDMGDLRWVDVTATAAPLRSREGAIEGATLDKVETVMLSASQSP